MIIGRAYSSHGVSRGSMVGDAIPPDKYIEVGFMHGTLCQTPPLGLKLSPFDLAIAALGQIRSPAPS